MRQIPPSRRMAELFLILVAVGWGVGFPIMKDAVNTHPVLTVMWLRFLLTTFIMLPFCWQRLKQLNFKTFIVGVTLGTVLFLSFFFLMQGLNLTTASNTGFLAGLCVIWVPIFERFFLGKSPAFSAKIAVVFGLIGIVVMSELDQLILNTGDILVVIGSIFTALHVLGVDSYSHRYDNLLLTFIQITTISILTFFTVILNGDQIIPATFDNTLIIALVITAIFSTALAFWIQTTFQRYTTPTRAMLIFNLEPVFSAVFAVILLQESLSLRVVVGGMIIFTGMVLPGLYSAIVSRELTQ